MTGLFVLEGAVRRELQEVIVGSGSRKDPWTDLVFHLQSIYICDLSVRRGTTRIDPPYTLLAARCVLAGCSKW